MKKLATNGAPLAGVRVLVGRARHQAGALSAELRKVGAEVVEIPFIEIRKPRSFQPLDSAVKNLDSYDWLILTSVNGVEAMWARMEKLRRRHVPDRLLVAAIGPARSKVKGKRVLLVRARVARDVIPRELRKAGAQVDVVEAYETIVPESSRVRLKAALANARRRPQVVTFTSSSTVKNFVELLGRKLSGLDGILMSSIGPVTSATLKELGLKADIKAREYTIPGLVTAIRKAFVLSPR
jgi:uroporphyrinogen-III synthase